MSDQERGRQVSDKDMAMGQRKSFEVGIAPRKQETQVEMFFKSLREKQEGVRRTLQPPKNYGEALNDVQQIALAQTPYALIDYFRASVYDELDSPNKSKMQFKKLKAMENASAELAASIPVPPNELAMMRTYITEQLEKAQEEQGGGAEVLILEAFLDRLHNPIDLEEEKAGADEVEAYVHAQDTHVTADTAPVGAAPENTHTLSDETNAAREALKENPDFKHVARFVQCIKTDHEASEDVKRDEAAQGDYDRRKEQLAMANNAAENLANGEEADPYERYSLLQVMGAQRELLVEQHGEEDKTAAALFKLMNELYAESEKKTKKKKKNKKKDK